ncbi:hypothetical protein [Sphingobium algorifonticola]|uniref:Membrane protein YkvI n=1 Tax=Sphingobium algorifonticola TaxID=2008318 RepID=A0A437J5Q8_9SPHN|nr:hypothetical protein [Sphingobium algorifonticola]RVT40268.1 hypothetical protein ENE74_13160 [Sphingobium algorifonticola]
MSGVNAGTAGGTSGWFQRYVLPGFAFKALVIGGGYATGRELAEFFLPSGPWGGVLGMALAAAIWSAVAAATFAFARATGAQDYRSFFRELLGPAWFLFEIGFVMLMIIMLAVFGAAAGAIGAALFGWPTIVGTMLLVVLIAGFAAFGTEAVEDLFKYVSFLLYAVYALFLVLALTSFGDRIAATYATAAPAPGWIAGGLTYAGYNIVGAVLILPVVRHMRNQRDAVIAGLLAGPLAMLPALLFFICMAAWPEVTGVALPSDFLLERLNLPPVRWAFQIMIFSALLESGTGVVHAFNQRIAGAFGKGGDLPPRSRLIISLVLLTVAVFLADRIGLVGLIAGGYRYLSFGFLAIYVLPLLTIGLWRLSRGPRVTAGAAA